MIADRTLPFRSLTDDERALWRAVTRAVAPLNRKRMVSELNGALAEKKRAIPSTRGHATPVRVARAPKGLPPLLPLDRRTWQRIARGADAIDARIDLHGRSQSQAHDALLRFLHRAQGAGARIALVITGKGGSADKPADSRGVLKRQVPLWLALPEFRIYVSGFEEANVGHGGTGALYVRLRRGPRAVRE